MSQRSGAKYLHDQLARPATRPPSRPQSHQRAPADYTLAHAGRQLRIGPIAFWITVGTLVIMGVWSIATATYFGFRDDVLTHLIARQADMQFAYEDRIADLRAQVDRITSRQLLDQESFEKRLDQMVQRQAALEKRTSALAAIADPVLAASALIAAHAGARAMMPIFMLLVPQARADGLSADAGRPSFTRAAIAGVLGLIALGLGLSSSAAIIAVLLLLAASAALAWLCTRQIGGQTGDVLGALEQTGEILILLTAARLV